MGAGQGGCYRMTNDPQARAARLVAELAQAKAIHPPKDKDWRVAAWDDAQAIGRGQWQARQLMAFAGAIRKRGITDRFTIQRMMRLIVQRRIKSPIAYFSPNGNAAMALKGQRSVELAEERKARILESERDFFARLRK